MTSSSAYSFRFLTYRHIQLVAKIPIYAQLEYFQDPCLCPETERTPTKKPGWSTYRWRVREAGSGGNVHVVHTCTY